MPELPKDVEALKQAFSRDPSDKLSNIASKLMLNTPELVSMWKTLEKHEADSDDPWVWIFLEAVSNSKELPRFHFKTPTERKELSDKITNLANSLSTTLKDNGLDAHIIHNNGKMFNGFFFYEDFGESNQASIDADGVNKLKMTELLESFSERTQERIGEEPIPGKSGKNEAAIRFIRLIAERNMWRYQTPLNKVIAVTVNALFETNYSEGHIAGLRNR